MACTGPVFFFPFFLLNTELLLVLPNPWATFGGFSADGSGGAVAKHRDPARDRPCRSDNRAGTGPDKRDRGAGIAIREVFILQIPADGTRYEALAPAFYFILMSAKYSAQLYLTI
jgi:hypothetical protein